mgnify:CR=1 FL=1
MSGICVICLGSLKDNASDGNKSINWFQGNNPDPVKDHGRACDKCNDTVVIPARINQMLGG